MITEKQKTITGIIDGESTPVDYVVKEFPAMKGIRICVSLARMLGSGLGQAASSGGDILNMDISSLVSGLTQRLDEDETARLITSILSNTQRNGVFLMSDVIDKVYAGNYGEMFEALKFALEVNFGGFIQALVAAQDTGYQPEKNK